MGADSAHGRATWTVVGAWGRWPAPGGALRGHLARSGAGGALLVGAGSGVVGRLGYHLESWAELSAVLLPDLAPEHISDLWALGNATAAAVEAGKRRGLLTVLAPLEPIDAWRALGRPGVLDVRGLGPGDTMHCAGWRCTLFSEGEGQTVVRLEAAGGTVGLVCAGTRPLVPAPLSAARLLIVELGPREGGGLGPAEAAQLAAGAAAETLLLCHRDPGDPVAEMLAEARARFANTLLGLEGRTYDVPPAGDGPRL